MSFNFAPQGWAMCNGQLLPINQNQALFSLLGTFFGGNGQTNFGLPDLRGQVPIHFGKHTLGEKGGKPSHTLSMAEMTAHTHIASASNTAGATNDPGNNVLGNSAPNTLFGPVQNLTTANDGTISNAGGSQAHENRQPFLTLTFCIALVGIFPSRN